jgi:hypothetical protein
MQIGSRESSAGDAGRRFLQLEWRKSRLAWSQTFHNSHETSARIPKTWLARAKLHLVNAALVTTDVTFRAKWNTHQSWYFWHSSDIWNVLPSMWLFPALNSTQMLKVFTFLLYVSLCWERVHWEVGSSSETSEASSSYTWCIDSREDVIFFTSKLSDKDSVESKVVGLNTQS